MATAEELITENIHLWTGAIKRKSGVGRGKGSSKKIELYGVKKLRELILEMAVRGLLVPQDASDEPASVLLERIAAEKSELVKEKKIKKQKALPSVDDVEKIFPLPTGWQWARLQLLVTLLGDGLHGTPEYDDSGSYYFVNGNNLNSGVINIKPETKKVTAKVYEKYKKDLNSRTVLVSINGTLGKIAFYNDEPIMLGKSACYFNLGSKLSKPFVKVLIESPYFLNYAFTKATGSTIKNLGLKAMNNFPLALPPLEEQHRIVAKVDELMALCDQLEQQTEANINAHQILVETLLQAITRSDSSANSAESIELLFANFDSLFTTEDSVDQLKQTILQLAVMGKLVPQDPSDEPASVLLEKIAAEKEKLVKEKKIKKVPSVEPIGEVVDLPVSWKEVVVQDFADIRLGSTPSRSEAKYWSGNIPWVSSGEVANGVIKDTKEKITQEGFDKSSVSMIPSRSLLMAIIGQGKTRGQTAILGVDACTNQNVAAFVFNENYVVPEYVWLWAKSKYDAHRGDGRGGAQPALNGKIVRSFRFPLAPIKEQIRIVEKVEELTKLCDQLKAQLNTAQTTQLHLADAVTEQAIA